MTCLSSCPFRLYTFFFLVVQVTSFTLECPKSFPGFFFSLFFSLSCAHFAHRFFFTNTLVSIVYHQKNK
ncbi:hypothetical protein DM01DRAFT_83436 [Hesseltinella vesiculosa]|uniref:Uncharacterized protein n=1 Tax=Hesseltinella vesiculosa TaxID=101127 RepID=A0A1X2GWU1_9FUNG|nr:hypothetical protein DM01DRAFT_83436 [Hesseltinella vesiculosa]